MSSCNRAPVMNINIVLDPTSKHKNFFCIYTELVASELRVVELQAADGNNLVQRQHTRDNLVQRQRTRNNLVQRQRTRAGDQPIRRQPILVESQPLPERVTVGQFQGKK